MIRLSNTGDVIWEKFYGGFDNDLANSVTEVSDGFIFVGYSHGVDMGNILNEHIDLWVVKIGFDGEILWEETIGGTSTDSSFDIIETRGGDLAITGTTKSRTSDWPIVGQGDLVFIKLSPEGTLLNSKSYGTEFYDVGLKILEEEDGDFIIGGSRSRGENGIFENPESVSYTHLTLPTTPYV